jgi:hypothetical protein
MSTETVSAFAQMLNMSEDNNKKNKVLKNKMDEAKNQLGVIMKQSNLTALPIGNMGFLVFQEKKSLPQINDELLGAIFRCYNDNKKTPVNDDGVSSFVDFANSVRNKLATKTQTLVFTKSRPAHTLI